MSDDVMGSSAQLLGVAQQGAANVQQQQNLEAQQNQKVADNALAPQQKAGEVSAVNAADKIAITPEMANGLSKMTGDDGWKRAAGTKWDPRIFTAVVGMQSKRAYEQDLIGDKDKLQALKEAADEKKQSDEDAAKAKRQADEDAAKKQREDDALAAKKARQKEEDDAKAKRAKEKGGSGEAAPDKEFLKTYRSYQNDMKGFNSVLLAQMAKTDPTKAKELQDKQIFLQKNQGRFNKLQDIPDDTKAAPAQDDDQKITDYIKQNGLKDTPANREWVKTKING